MQTVICQTNLYEVQGHLCGRQWDVQHRELYHPMLDIDKHLSCMCQVPANLHKHQLYLQLGVLLLRCLCLWQGCYYHIVCSNRWLSSAIDEFVGPPRWHGMVLCVQGNGFESCSESCFESCSACQITIQHQNAADFAYLQSLGQWGVCKECDGW